jgi:hypothetical protein
MLVMLLWPYVKPYSVKEGEGNRRQYKLVFVVNTVGLRDSVCLALPLLWEIVWGSIVSFSLFCLSSF